MVLPKIDGGLGFRDRHTFNLAMLTQLQGTIYSFLIIRNREFDEKNILQQLLKKMYPIYNSYIDKPH